MSINWPEVVVGAFLGFLLGLVPSVLAVFKRLRSGFISFSNSEFIQIHKVMGKVLIDEPQDGTHTGNLVTIRGTVTDFSGNPLDTSDVLFLVQSRESDEWRPIRIPPVWADPDGKWDADITLPEIGSGHYEILAAALPLDSCRMVRDKSKVRFSAHPKHQENLARLRVYHSPQTSWPISISAAKRTDWLRPDVKDFLQRSALDLFAIDSAITTYLCPISEGGWEGDHQIDFDYQPILAEDDLPLDFLEMGRAFRQENPDRKDSVKYCVTELLSLPPDAGGRLEIRAQAIKYLTTLPVTDRLRRSLGPGEERSFREDCFPRLRHREIPLRPNTLIAHVLVVTGDGRLLLARRRDDRALDFYRGRWSATFEEHYNAPWFEHLQRQEVHPESLAVDKAIFEGLRRGLEEEMKMSTDEISDAIIRVPAVGFEYDNLNTNIYAVVRLPRRLTATKMEDRLKSSIEHDMVTSCPFEVNALLQTLTSSQPPQTLDRNHEMGSMEWKWHPTSRMRILLALRSHYGELYLRRWFE